MKVTNVMTQKQALKVTYVLTHPGNLCPDICQLTVKDKNTIIFRLMKPAYNFPNLLTLPYTSIVKKKAVDFYGAKFKLHPVGTGPFTLVSFESNQKVTLAKNKSYWEEQAGKHLPIIDGVIISLTTDDNLSFLMFKNQKSDFLELNLPLQHQLENTKLPFNYKKEVLEWTQLNLYLFNLKRISDKNLRQGINFAVDRKELQNIIGDQGVVAKSLYPSIFSELTAPQTMLNYAPDKATGLLKGKKTLNLVCFEDILSRALADDLSKQLMKFGIELKIEAVTFPVLVDRLTKGNYDIIQLYWGPLYADVSHFLNPFVTASFPPAGNNFNKYSNPDFDKLVETTPQLPTNKQAVQYLKAQDIILDDMPFLPVYYKNFIRVSNNKFTMPIHPLGYRFYKFARMN
jgi:oligopeptide transport system substrate-binding protein